MKIFLFEVISQSKKRNKNKKIINEIQNKNMREVQMGFCFMLFKTMKIDRRNHLLFQRKDHKPSINDTMVHGALMNSE